MIKWEENGGGSNLSLLSLMHVVYTSLLILVLRISREELLGLNSYLGLKNSFPSNYFENCSIYLELGIEKILLGPAFAFVFSTIDSSLPEDSR